MLKCPALISLFIVIVLGTLMIVRIQGAPVFNTLAARSSIIHEPTESSEGVYLTSLASPPLAREERDVSPTPPSPTSPRELPFIKVISIAIASYFLLRNVIRKTSFYCENMI